LQRQGCRVLGLERSAAGLAGCAERGVPALAFDIRSDPLPDPARGDLCLCFEVAEHLPPESAARLVELVTSIAPRTVFTAATPGQGGVGHFNEQPHDYWLGLFARQGWQPLSEVSAALSEQWRSAGVVSWLPDNLMVLERRSP
jgi:SAM-dependent methyltransferase